MNDCKTHIERETYNMFGKMACNDFFVCYILQIDIHLDRQIGKDFFNYKKKFVEFMNEVANIGFKIARHSQKMILN